MLASRKPEKNGAERRGILSRLAVSTAGNTTIIMAAALIPLTGLIGAGFDVGRAYLVKSRLQTACDSGVLAGRRMMTGASWSAASQAVADQYFAANFQSGRYGAFNQTHNFVGSAGGIVSGSGSASVPTTLMKIFGRTETDVAVTCKAVMNLPNTDVMFVLDTTGSMADTNLGDPVPKIQALRNSVTSFYSSLEAAKSTGTQVRYGFVPYATNVNVGRLLQRDWMADRWTYQSREPDGTSSSSSAGGFTLTYVDSGWRDVTGSSAWTPSQLPLESCNQPADTVVWGPNIEEGTPLFYNSSGTQITEAEYNTLAASDSTKLGIKKTQMRSYTASGKRYGINRSATVCTLFTQDLTGFKQEYLSTATWESTTSATSTAFGWRYKPIQFTVSALKGTRADGLMEGGSVSAQVGSGQTTISVPWDGCIEERATVPFSGTTIPAGAIDLDIDRIPNGNPATQWGPLLPGLVFQRDTYPNWQLGDLNSTVDLPSHAAWQGGSFAVCPTPARKLNALSSGELSTYLNSLVPSGGTIHDHGMLWGLRLLSPTGLFASENATTTNGSQITRHIVFMTDGETQVLPESYDPYGLEWFDRRRTDPSATPTLASLNSAVEDRLLALCNRAKARNTTVWVIAFGTSLTSLLQDCASTGSAFQANNATQLNTAFSEIASKIANLRLSE